MPFDPNLPQENTLADAAQMRAQLNGLKTLIDTIPGITSVVVDSVTTLNPGESATATFTLIGTVLHISLALPRGADGIPGLQGVAGLQGPPFANAVIDSVTTLGPGQPASVSQFFDGSNVHFSFGIPQGAQGEQGIQGIQGPPITNAVIDSITTVGPGQPASVSVFFDGSTAHFSFTLPQGAQGEQGIQGPMGEVSNATLASAISSAIAGTSNNTNSVATLDTAFADPDMEALRQKMNEMILAARR